MEQAENINAQSMNPRFSDPPTSLGTLGNLPPEIRNMIYALVITSELRPGSRTVADHHTALLRTSKDLHLDSRYSMYCHSVYHISIQKWPRLNIYDVDQLIDKQPSPQALAHIRDLDIRIEGCGLRMGVYPKVPLWGCPGDVGLSGRLKGLVQQMKMKRSCRLGFHNLLKPDLAPVLLELLEILQKFDSVAIEFTHVEDDLIQRFTPMDWQIPLRMKSRKLEHQAREKLRRADGRGPGPALTFRYRLQCLSGELLEL